MVEAVRSPVYAADCCLALVEREWIFSSASPDLLGRKPQFVILLQVHPDIRPRPKPPAEAQSRVTGNSPLATNDLRNPVRRHAQFFCQFVGAHAESLQLVGQVFPWMNDKSCHELPPSDNPRFPR